MKAPRHEDQGFHLGDQWANDIFGYHFWLDNTSLERSTKREWAKDGYTLLPFNYQLNGMDPSERHLINIVATSELPPPVVRCAQRPRSRPERQGIQEEACRKENGIKLGEEAAEINTNKTIEAQGSPADLKHSKPNPANQKNPDQTVRRREASITTTVGLKGLLGIPSQL